MAVEVLTLRSLVKPATSFEVAFKRGVEGAGEKRIGLAKISKLFRALVV